MTLKEIETAIEYLKDERFYLAMKDRWDNKDYDRDRQLLDEIERLEEKRKEA